MKDTRAIEIWGGIEATVNRVGDEYFDQLEKSGHAYRLEDLDLLAKLGISKLRYPILWERMAPEKNKSIDWTWAEERLYRLRTLQITPIVGLVHHGSGPRYTNLLDQNFPDYLAEYALALAKRFPWIDYYTPVNEPLTTARFSALYGLWYPHQKDPTAFLRALINQCKGTVLAMQAIRSINPHAKLVQTEDIGKVYGTQPLQYQVDFENERRWLTYDLLSGRVGPKHSMWSYIKYAGISKSSIILKLK